MSEQQRSDHGSGVSKDGDHKVIDFVDNHVALAFCILIVLLGVFSYVLSLANHH
jgi:hypothetical protein